MDWIRDLMAACAVLLVLYIYGTRNHNYWKRKGVRQTYWKLPFVGDSYQMIFKMKNPLELMQMYYDTFKGERFGGIYVFNVPFLIIRDPELLKQILVKDADCFFNRYEWTNNSDPLFSKNLFALKDEKWKNLRRVMATVFTASKMKDMFLFIEKCAEQSAQNMYLKLLDRNAAINSEKDVLEMEFKDYFSRYGTDVIASTAFGIEVDSFKNPNNEFYTAGQLIKKGFSGFNMFRIIIMLLFPKIAEKLKLAFFQRELNDFLVAVVNEAISEREKNNIIRKDVIHILMEARKGKHSNENGESIKEKLTDFTNADIAAQAMLFFFGGFDTMATVLAFTCYELATHPDIQENLYNEIVEITESENGVTYEGIMHKMAYLDMVINETLRKWPPAINTDRKVTKAYVIPKTDNSPEVVLSTGDQVWIPISALHRDPEYFPDPNKFDPERFRDEKNTVKPYTYLPFGAGLRHCIGMRYALMEAKTCLVHLLMKFQVVPTNKTQIPLRLKKSTAFVLRPEHEFVMALKSRN